MAFGPRPDWVNEPAGEDRLTGGTESVYYQ